MSDHTQTPILDCGSFVSIKGVKHLIVEMTTWGGPQGSLNIRLMTAPYSIIDPSIAPEPELKAAMKKSKKKRKTK